MKPGSKTRTRQTLGGGTKTVTRTKSSTGAKTRIVERTKGDFHKEGLSSSRKIVRRDKSGVSKMKTSSLSKTNRRTGTISTDTRHIVHQEKNTFRKRGSLKKERRTLSSSNDWLTQSVDLNRSKLKKDSSKPYSDAMIRRKTGNERDRDVVKKELPKKEYKKESKWNRSLFSQKDRTPVESLSKTEHRAKAFLKTDGASRRTNEEIRKSYAFAGRNVDLSKQQETGKTYTPKRK